MRSEWRKDFLRRLVDLRPEPWILLETRPEFLDEEDIKLLAQLKVEIQFGVESASPEMLRIMNKTRQPEKFLDEFVKTSRLLSEHDIVHGANLVFNHPGENVKTLNETYAFIDKFLAQGQSSLFWACNAYAHYPGNEIDRNQEYYEEKYGTEFLSLRWWAVDRDYVTAGREVIPSSELRGEKMGLWKKMLMEREEQLKSALTPKAFDMAAKSYFPGWQADARFQGDGLNNH